MTPFSHRAPIFERTLPQAVLLGRDTVANLGKRKGQSCKAINKRPGREGGFNYFARGAR